MIIGIKNANLTPKKLCSNGQLGVLWLLHYIPPLNFDNDSFFRNSPRNTFLGPHFLCWFSGTVPFNTWPISSWEENEYWYKLKLSFWVKIVVILSVLHLVTTIIFFSAWDKSYVKWDNCQNSTQKIRTYILHSTY